MLLQPDDKPLLLALAQVMEQQRLFEKRSITIKKPPATGSFRRRIKPAAERSLLFCWLLLKFVIYHYTLGRQHRHNRLRNIAVKADGDSSSPVLITR